MSLRVIYCTLVCAIAAKIAGASFQTCDKYFEEMGEDAPPGPKDWCASGSYWNFTSPANDNETVRLFGRCSEEDDESVTLFMGHGWPTSSFDFSKISAILEKQSIRTCQIDYVGAGFSEKPSHRTTGSPWRYHISDHAKAIHDFAVSRGLKSFAYLTHDEGSSVGLELLRIMEQNRSKGYENSFELIHHFVLDGSIYLPLANLTHGQHLLLSNVTGPIVEKALLPSVLAAGMGRSVYSPALNKTEVRALESVLAFDGGTFKEHDTIQYLQDRKIYEDDWLEVLYRSPVNCSLIWGTEDPVAVIAIADYVWENYLKDRPNASATYTKIEGANHYLQYDHASRIAEIIVDVLFGP